MFTVESMENVEKKKKKIEVSLGCSPATITWCVFTYM